MSWYLANEHDILDQVASVSGLIELREAVRASGALASFFEIGVTKNILLCRIELEHIAKEHAGMDVAMTAQGLADAMDGETLVGLTQGFGDAENVSESLKHPKHADALRPIRETATTLIERFFRRQCIAVIKALSGHLKVLAREAAAENLDAISLALPSGYTLPVSVSGSMSTDYSDALRSAINAGYDVLAEEFGATSVDGRADLVEQFLRDRSLTKITGNINATTVDRLRTALADAYESGADYDGMVQAIRDEYSSFSSVRAGMIAQTEMNAAYNAGRKQLGIDAGMNEKSWNPDGIACPNCMGNVAEGWIGMDEPFATGDDAPPAHPNCDCSLDVRFSRPSP